MTNARQFADCSPECANIDEHTMHPGCILWAQQHQPEDERIDPLSDELLDGLLKTLPADSDVVYEAIGRYVVHRLETHRDVFGAAMRQLSKAETELAAAHAEIVALRERPLHCPGCDGDHL